MLKEGDKVETNYKGRGTFYPGRVRNMHASGSVDADSDASEAERETIPPSFNAIYPVD
jgi:hypothetical protein